MKVENINKIYPDFKKASLSFSRPLLVDKTRNLNLEAETTYALYLSYGRYEDENSYNSQ